MPHQSSHDASLEFAKLLELLIASEAVEEMTFSSETFASQSEDVSSGGTIDPDPNLLADGVADEIENPFAAHVAKGMLKLKEG